MSETSRGQRHMRGGGRVRRNRQHRILAAVACIAASFAATFVSLASPSEAASPNAETKSIYGPYGPEGPRLREQFWMLPGGDPDNPLRATVFRPADPPGAEQSTDVRRPMVVINHGTSDATRMAVAMPVYYWLSRWFVDRGYVVVLPQRRGHGATGGPLAEGVGDCADPDHYLSGLMAADDIEATINYMANQPFVAPAETVVVGISSGGWASLALAARNPKNVRAVINIAGGRGGRPFGKPSHAVCGEERLLEAAQTYGETARVPTLWLYAQNDSLFRPDLARAMAAAWTDGGGKAELHVFAPYGYDGHNIADDRAGWDVWGSAVERFLIRSREAPVAESGSQTAPLKIEAIATQTRPGSASDAEAADGETHAP